MMKKFFKYASLVLGATVLFASCEKETAINDKAVADGEVLISIKATEGVDSKTYIDGTAVKWSASGEVLKVYEVKTPTEGEAVKNSNTSSQGVTGDGGATMTFDVSMPEPGEGTFTFDYYAFYPASANGSGSTVTNIAINTPSAQAPIATSFDPSADLLIARHISNGSSQATNLNMEFARMVAIAKMTIKNLESTDPVTKITFSAKEGENAIKLAGRTAFNLTDGSLVNTYGGNVGDTSIILDVEALDTINGNADTEAGMTTYFTCYPFAINSSNPGSFKVIVETASQTFTKEVSVSSAKGLALNAGKASTFAIDMDNIEGENKAVNLCYAFLEYSDVSSQLSNSYGNARVTKAHGDTWSMYATNANSSVIALKNGDVNSYLKLPDFEDDITSVKVTLSEVTAGKTLTFDSVQGEKDGDISEVALVAETLEYTVDLSSANVKTAYIHADGLQAKIVKVEVFAGSDTRAAFDAPATVTAELNDDDANVTNSIDVSWSSVDGAAGYVITLVPDSGDDVVVRVGAVTSTTVEDLQYEMDYLVSVQAEPADYYLNKISGQTTAGEVVTTGAEPGGSYWELVSSISGITADDYYLLATNDKANVYNGSVNSGHLQTVGVAAVNDRITDSNLPNTAAQILFVSSGNTNGYYLKVGNKYISATKAGSGGFANNGTTPFEWTFSGTDGMNAVGTTYAAYIRSYNNSSFRSYANTSNGAVFYLYKFVENDTRDDASLVWKKNSVAADSDTASLETGADTLPTIALDNTAHSHPVTYSSSNTDVATIVESGVGAGTITLVAAGETTISAIFAGDEDYKPLTVSYTLTVSDNRTKVATPTFSPAAGEVEANQVVTISCGTAGATIYYTTDGSTPTTSSTQGTSVTIDAAKTIKAIAVNDDYKNSDVAEAAYTLAGVSSTISQVLAGGAGSYTINNILVYSVVGNQAIVGDNTGKMVLFKSGHGLAAGDNISIPSATVAEYKGILQIQDGTFNKNSTGNSVDHGSATDLNNSATATSTLATFSAAGYHAATYVTMNGTQSSRNINGTNASLYLSADNATYDGQAVTVTGYIYYYNSSYSNYNFQLVSIAPDESTPTISVAPASLSWAADATDNKTLAVTLNGAADAGDYSYEVTSGTAGDWNISDNNAGTITVSPKAANQSTENAKFITLRIKHADAPSTVYQDVTCTQAQASGGGGTEYTSTLTFTAKCNGSGTADDGASWTVTSDGTESTFDNTKGIHYGTNSAQVQYIRLTTSDIPGTISRVVVNASTASSVSATVSVTVGGSAFGGAAQSLTTSAANYTFDGSASGEIVVTVTKPSKAAKAIYVKSIVVTYTN